MLNIGGNNSNGKVHIIAKRVEIGGHTVAIIGWGDISYAPSSSQDAYAKERKVILYRRISGP